MVQHLPVLAKEMRGSTVEATHRGAIVAVDPQGRVVAQAGSAELITTTRSTIKPIQAIPFITSGAADLFEVTARELAVACGSHYGEPRHVNTVAGMLARIGLDESALRCGVHRPFSEVSAREIELSGRPFTQLHNNCSGKHAAMLMTGVHRGLEIENYTSPSHPVQTGIRSIFSSLSGLHEEMPAGIDGCGAPTFGVPIRALALAFARLVSPREGLMNLGSEANGCVEIAQAAQRIINAILVNPDFIGGSGAFDTDLIKASGGRLIAKIGARAVYTIGVLSTDRFPDGLGIAIKVEGGDNTALYPIVVETLLQLGLLGEPEQRRLEAYHRPILKNYNNVNVGEVLPVFELTVMGGKQ